MPSLPHLVLWDVDGTLVGNGTWSFLRRAIARTYGLSESEILQTEASVVGYHGTTDEFIALDVARRSGVATAHALEGLPRFGEAMNELALTGHDEVRASTTAVSGASVAIGRAHALGIAQSLLTGNLESTARMKLEAFGLDTHIDFGLGAYGGDARNRADLGAFVLRRFAARHGTELDPSLAVVIGDTPGDVSCARHVGFRVIAVAGGAFSLNDLRACSPDAVLPDLEDSEALVDALRMVAEVRASG